MITLDVPMKPATKALAGRSYSSRGVATCCTMPVLHDGDALGHRERLFLIVRHVDEGGAGAWRGGS